MNAADVIKALGLPANTRIDRRIHKKLIVENSNPTTADLRQINEGIESLQCIASLKPTNIGVPAYRDDTREILEIIVLYFSLRPAANVGRLAELVHRAIPYPVVLIIEQGSSLTISLAQKRWSQGEIGKAVLDGEIVENRLDDESEIKIPPDFWEALNLSRQPHNALFALYQGWINTVLALQACCITGIFTILSSEEHAAARREALQACQNIDSQMASLRTVAVKEKQLPRQVELNLKLKRLEADYAAAYARL